MNKEIVMAQFLKDTKKHLLTIKQDEGLYRHLLLSNPESSACWYGIVTWPGCLCIYGDMGTYVFARLQDMFQFHRGNGFECIDRRYWAEKLEATNKSSGHTEFSSEAFKEALDTYYEEWTQDDPEDDAEINDPVVRKAVREELDDLVARAENEYQAHELARDFESSSGHELRDFWEHDLTRYTHHFTWCCFAIRKAIEVYDRTKLQGDA